MQGDCERVIPASFAAMQGWRYRLGSMSIADQYWEAAAAATSSSSSAPASSTIYLLHKNFNPVCWRKGTDGVEPRGGAAGCCDPTKENSREWGR